MNVFVTGSTGFVGNAVVRQLVAAGHTVHALVRPGSEDKLQRTEGVAVQLGDVTDGKSLREGMEHCEAVIHLVGIIREFPGKGVTFEKLHVEATKNVLAAASDTGIMRYLHMSANGTRPDAETGYHRTKWKAEEAVRDSGLDWTIFRPSLIYGKGGEFVEMIADLVRKMPIVPVIGDGQYRMQPVSVDQVATAFVKALEISETTGQTYHVCGRNDYTYDEVIDLFGTALGKQDVFKLHHPLLLMKPAVSLLQSTPQFPITSDQLTMMLEGNTCESMEWAETFGIEPEDFADGLKKCIE